MISRSPFNDSYEYEINAVAEIFRLREFIHQGAHRKVAVVQGLGFVGAAMVAALTVAKTVANDPCYQVIGVDLPDEANFWKIARVNAGQAPVVSSDSKIDRAYQEGACHQNLTATYSDEAYALADVVVIDIHLDIYKKSTMSAREYDFSYDTFLNSIRTVARKVRENVLIVIETTVPPGTTEKNILPIFQEEFKIRGLDIHKLHLAHSYERVMPGPDYLNSINAYYRTFSGINFESRAHVRAFLETFIDVESYPLCELHSTVASEMGKVLENSYRAMNIAFIQEWTEFAESANVNLFEVIDAIRMRTTHRNIMLPGFGVGGYCLTKDSLLADWSFRKTYGNSRHLDLALRAIQINDQMPDHTFNLIQRHCETLKGRTITLMGVSYLQDVADSRYTPSAYFYQKCVNAGAIVQPHDPLIPYWQELNLAVITDLEALTQMRHNVVVFAVRHAAYLMLTASDVLRLFPGVELVVDSNNVLSDTVALEICRAGKKILGVGKGHWNQWGHSSECGR